MILMLRFKSDFLLTFAVCFGIAIVPDVSKLADVFTTFVYAVQ